MTDYDMRITAWISDVCSSDLGDGAIEGCQRVLRKVDGSTGMGNYEHVECHLRRVKEVLACISAPTVRCPNAATRARLPPRLSRRHVKLVTNTRDPTRRGGTSWPSPKAAPCTSPSSATTGAT